MSKNKLTQEQYKKAFDELQESTNKVDSLERLANDFDTTPKGLKLGLRIVFQNRITNGSNQTFQKMLAQLKKN